MDQNRQRIFVYSSLMNNLQNLHKIESDSFLGAAASAPLYVMLHATLSEFDFGQPADIPDDQAELYELDEEDLDLIKMLDNHPEFFQRVSIHLDDGTEAVAYDLAQQKIYTIHRVTDENDWMTVMRTFDPTWMVGPRVPVVGKKKKRK